MESGWFYNRQILILPIVAKGPISSGSSEADMICTEHSAKEDVCVWLHRRL